jgi:hypothetical protein
VTFYSRYGDVFAILCAIIAVGVTAQLLRRLGSKSRQEINQSQALPTR